MKKIIIIIVLIILLMPISYKTYSFIKGRIKENSAERQPETVTLSPFENFSGEAEATREYLNKNFKLSIKAKINNPAPEKFYEVWLAKYFPYGSLLSVGVLKKEGLYYRLNYSSPVNKFFYNKIIISEESQENGLDGKIEKKVFIGEGK